MSEREDKRRGPGRPKEPQKRERLIGIARQVFAESGYAGTSLTRIALAAGLSKPALFHHFKNKDSLYEAVLLSTLKHLAQVIGESNLSDGSYVERLCGLGGRLADFFGEFPEAAQLLLREFVNGGPFTTGAGRQQVQMTARIAVAFVAAGAEAGEFNVDDPRRVVLAACGHLLFYYGARQMTDDLLDEDGLNVENRAQQRATIIADFCRLTGSPVPGR